MKTKNEYPKNFTKAALVAFPKSKKLQRLIAKGNKDQVGIMINEGLKPTYFFTADEVLRASKKNDFSAIINKAELYQKRKNLLTSWVKITKQWR